MPGKLRPHLTVITGGMASGKSAELIRLAEREEHAGRSVLRLAPLRSRTHGEEIRSRTGRFAGAIPLATSADLPALLARYAPDVIAIDEAQFIDPDLAAVLEGLLAGGRPLHCIVAVLDLDFAARPFPGVGALLASADELIKLRAICVLCGEEASRSQRLVDGLPALMTTPLLAIESGTIEYQARCRSCYRAPSA